MARSNSRSPRLRLSESLSRVRVRSPSFQFKQSSDPLEMEQKMEFLGEEDQPQETFNGREGAGNNKVMVVVDSSFEAKAALEWALPHTVQAQDTLVLLHVAQPTKRESNNCKVNPRAYEWIQSMKSMCERKRPGVVVEIAIVEGKNRGEAIVEASKEKRTSLLVLGQKKKSLWRKLMRRLKIRRSQGVVDYCIQNASCMTIAVRKKSNKLGGYSITTKRHKKFWLLA